MMSSEPIVAYHDKRSGSDAADNSDDNGSQSERGKEAEAASVGPKIHLSEIQRGTKS